MNTIPHLWIHSLALLGLCFPWPGDSHPVARPAPGRAPGGHDTDRAQELAETRSTLLEGRVLLPGGAPAAGAVVVTSAGGKAVADESGGFRFEVEFALDARELQVTAAHPHQGVSLLATARVPIGLADGSIQTGALQLGAGGSCEPSWLPTFGGAPGLNRTVMALSVHDDGTGEGPALYVGGSFTSAGGVSANRIAKWDGTSWSALGSGMNSTVFALSVFDDGTGGGPALYASGSFTSAGGVSANRIAKWDGTSWSALGSGINGSIVYALEVYDDGAGEGPALYAAGFFALAGGSSANGIAKWDGSSWSALGGGMTGSTVYALTVYDDGAGGGPALYAGGSFTNAGGVSANRIAKWDGTSWSALGSGMNSFAVRALTTYDDGAGAGPALYAGGQFTLAGGSSASYVAKWDGSSWSALGSGMDDRVDVLTVYDDGAGGGPALYAGGYFTSAGGVNASHIARWDGTSWSTLGAGMTDRVGALAVYDDGAATGPLLHAGGDFSSAGGESVNHLASWDGISWVALGSGLSSGVSALTVHDDGAGRGPALYVGGSFTSAGGASASHVARWDGASWSALGNGLGGYVSDLAVYDDGAGAGPALYAGGTFPRCIARWDGTSWSELGGALEGGIFPGVHALAVYDDGAGWNPALYAGGIFLSAGGVSASRIAKWDGSSWSALGSGITGGTSPSVSVLAVYDDGAGGGPALYVGGDFTSAGGVSVNHIARWDGRSWSALGSGVAGGTTPGVYALAVHDDGAGGGPALYVGGSFTSAGGVSANRIAKWDGSSWSALGSGMDDSVDALKAYDDGTGGGPALYAGGSFGSAGGSSANYIAKWDGSSWSALGSGMDSFAVNSLTVYDDGAGGGPALYAGGGFSVSPSGDSYLARWGGCSGSATAYCTAGTSANGCQASIAASGTPSATAASGFSLHATGVEGAKDGLFFFGTSGQQANPWGNGTSYQCVVPPVKRCGLLAGTGTVGACDGAISQDLNAFWCSTCPKPGHNPGVGATVQAQLWYRDPQSSSNQTTSLSDAIEFVVVP